MERSIEELIYIWLLGRPIDQYGVRIEIVGPDLNRLGQQEIVTVPQLRDGDEIILTATL